ncbi:MAG: twin-arginine translocase subunit TatC [Armatimonadota bacterium]|jgi:sec-independent protein translocase protein TatC
MAEPREMDFFEHLDELRGRIIRCVIYVLVGMCVAWFFKGELMGIIQAPLQASIERANLPEDMDVAIFGPSLMSGLSYAIQLSLFGALLLSFPLMALEAWLFIEPALYAHEKKYAYIVLPASVALFAAGVGLFYLISPIVFGFLLSFFEDFRMKAMLDISKYIWLLVRMLLSFGIVFQLPLVVTFLARVGLVDHHMLLSKWRHAIVGILIASAIITPTVDPFTMSALAGPVIGLYMLSIALAAIFGRPRGEGEPEDEPEDEPPALPPPPEPSDPSTDDEVEDDTGDDAPTEDADEDPSPDDDDAVEESEDDSAEHEPGDDSATEEDDVAEEPEDRML